MWFLDCDISFMTVVKHIVIQNYHYCNVLRFFFVTPIILDVGIVKVLFMNNFINI